MNAPIEITREFQNQVDTDYEALYGPNLFLDEDTNEENCGPHTCKGLTSTFNENPLIFTGSQISIPPKVHSVNLDQGYHDILFCCTCSVVN